MVDFLDERLRDCNMRRAPALAGLLARSDSMLALVSYWSWSDWTGIESRHSRQHGMAWQRKLRPAGIWKLS